MSNKKNYETGARIDVRVKAQFEITDSDREWIDIQTRHLTNELIKRHILRREQYLDRLIFFCNNGYFQN